MDFGGLKHIKAWLEDKFDHTLLINEDDPEMEFFKEMDRKGLCRLRVLPNIGMERFLNTSSTMLIHGCRNRPRAVFEYQ